jgi:hypothetical protein
MNRHPTLASRLDAWDREVGRLTDLPAGEIVEMTMVGGGIILRIPALIAAEALRSALAQLSNLPDSEASERMGMVPVYGFSSDGSEDGFEVEVQPLTPTFMEALGRG